ncbi:MAG TPA: T9SS type A sorting domain-containing protein [Chitinophagaceae bacterium]|nr:T9SS type A sorting domain-containing protein [Chitinophagaceae bacterium]
MNKHIFTLILASVFSIAAHGLSVIPTVLATLPASLPESSGLDYSGTNAFWTHNDGYGDNHIYKLNSSGSITKTITVNNATNYDWEDITHDLNRNYLYIGDFGNNNCDRTNLHIYRITHPKNISGTSVTADVINFTYPDQAQFPSPWMNFDAEGFFHLNGLLYIFSKADANAVGYTKLYTVPDQPGSYVATLVDSFQTNDRITSADINADASAAIISTNSRIHIFSGWSGVNIFSGTHKMISISGSWTQKEAIAFKDINHVYMTDEDNGSGNNLYSVDLSTWIADMSTSIENIASTDKKITAFPNPANALVNFQVSGTERSGSSIQLFDIAGNKLREAKMSEATGLLSIETGDLPNGVYFYRLFENNKAIQTQRLIVSH